MDLASIEGPIDVDAIGDDLEVWRSTVNSKWSRGGEAGVGIQISGSFQAP